MSLPNLQEREKMIFGRNTSLTKIHKLYAQALYFKAIDSVNFVKLHSQEMPNNEAQSIYAALQAEIDKETPHPDSSNYNRYVAMKAIALLLQCSFVNLDKIRQAISLLEPIKTKPEGAYPYISAMIQMDLTSDALGNGNTNVENLLKAEAVFDHLKTSGIQGLTRDEIFGGKKYCLPSNHDFDSIMMNLFKKFAMLNNDAMKLKYVLPALKGIFNKEMLQNKIGIKMIKFEKTVPMLWAHIQCLIETHHFAQIDHLLSLFAFKLIKARRDMPSVIEMETQSKIDEAKALVSYWYALWAEELLTSAVSLSKEPDYALKNPIRTKIIRFEELMEAGVEIYEKQFPVDFIGSEKEWKKVHKKGKLWCQRAVDYFKKCKIVPDYHIPEEEDVALLLKRFDQHLLSKPDF